VLGDPSSQVGLATLGVALCGAGGVYAIGLPALRHHDVVIRSRIDPAHGDLPESMLSLARALHAQGADRVAVLTAVGAARAARSKAGSPAAPGVGDELEALWHQAATGTGALPPGVVERAIRLAHDAARASSPSLGEPG
jgi:hypothetical protein